MRAFDLSKKGDLAQLPPRKEPFWEPLEEPGDAVGFRAGPGTWIARHRDRDGHRHYRALDVSDYAEAKRAARTWCTQMRGPGGQVGKRGTVWEALKAYVEGLREVGREKAAKDQEGRYRVTVEWDVIAKIPLERLTADNVRAWRTRVGAGGKRQPRTVNRYTRALTAALNGAVTLGWVGNKASWTLPRLPDAVEEDGEAASFLTAAQRAALLEHASPAAARLFRALELTGARPGEMAAVVAGDVRQKLRLAHHKGRRAELQRRDIVLSPAGRRFFDELARAKASDSLLFTTTRGKPWDRQTWAIAFRAAAAACNAAGGEQIARTASAYSFRHSYISEILQLHHIDPITAAKQCGTSVGIIEKHYHSFIESAADDRLAALP